jgi:hypothetical protein
MEDEEEIGYSFMDVMYTQSMEVSLGCWRMYVSSPFLGSRIDLRYLDYERGSGLEIQIM